MENFIEIHLAYVSVVVVTAAASFNILEKYVAKVLRRGTRAEILKDLEGIMPII